MRKIFVVVERRADYSRIRPILQKLKKDKFFKIHLVVTGVCLLPLHGSDIKYIESDGFDISAKISMFKKGEKDNPSTMVKAMARYMLAVVDELEKAKPDIVLTGFDIGANFATTVAAAHMNIPVAHIQGGEVTGSIDESIRHAMSKFAHIHFPATKLSKERLIKMGENPDNIYVVGCPSLDVIKNTSLISNAQLEKFFNLDFSKPTVLVIQHPVTTENQDSLAQIKETISAIKASGVQAIFLLPNNDAGFSNIISSIKRSGFRWYPSLPTKIFINMYSRVRAIVGNSSSGIHESVTFGVPAVNVGSRQNGRERANNVIDVGYNKLEIAKAIKKALFDETYRRYVKNLANPYGDGESARRIVKVLKTVKLENLVQKQFYDSK